MKEKKSRARRLAELAGLMEQAWLNQLSLEFDAVCYQYGVDLQPPVFALSHGQSQLGSYHPETRQLKISAWLIAEHPWQITLQVLKHEMAHQICHELLGERQTAHGRAFKQACAMIGVVPAFQAAAADTDRILSSFGADAPASTEHRILAKVRKLFGLGRSGNEHEAALALQKAEALLREHNLTTFHLHEDDFEHRCIDTGKQRMAVHVQIICSILDTHFHVRVIRGTQYNPFKDCQHQTIELLGTRENVAVAEHCYFFLEERLESLWLRYRKTREGRGRIAKKSYFIGLLNGFSQRLEAEKQAPVVNRNTEVVDEKALVIQEEMLDRFVQHRFPRLRKRKTSGTRIQPQAYERGSQDGKDLHLHKGVPAGQQRLLS